MHLITVYLHDNINCKTHIILMLLQVLFYSNYYVYTILFLSTYLQIILNDGFRLITKTLNTFVVKQTGEITCTILKIGIKLRQCRNGKIHFIQ